MDLTRLHLDRSSKYSTVVKMILLNIVTSKGSLVKSIKKALKLYENQHFNVTTVYMDTDFECLNFF